MAQMADLDVVAQEHGIHPQRDDALVTALSEIRTLDVVLAKIREALALLPGAAGIDDFIVTSGRGDVVELAHAETAVDFQLWLELYGGHVRRVIRERDDARRDILGFQRVTGVNRGA